MFSNIDFTGSATSFTRFVSVEGTFEACQSFTTAATSDIISPGLVLEGTKCGNEMVRDNYTGLCYYKFTAKCAECAG